MTTPKTPNLDRILADSTNALGERNILDTKLRDAVALDIAAAVAEERRAVVAWLDTQCENCETPEECEEALRDAAACIDGRHHITKKEEG